MASLVKRRLTWLVHVTAIITSCEPPKVVGEVTSSVTVTGVPEVYGFAEDGLEPPKLPGPGVGCLSGSWLEGDADPRAHGPVVPEASLYPLAELDD